MNKIEFRSSKWKTDGLIQHKFLVSINSDLNLTQKNTILNSLNGQNYKNWKILEDSFEPFQENTNYIILEIRGSVELYPNYLSVLNETFSNGNADLVYSDFHFNYFGNLIDSRLPVWSEHLFSQFDYLGLCIAKKFKTKNEGDLREVALSDITRHKSIARIPMPLYVDFSGNYPSSFLRQLNSYQSNFQIKLNSVSIVIPTYGKVSSIEQTMYLESCIKSISEFVHPKFTLDVIIVADDNENFESVNSVVEKYESSLDLKVVKYSKPFNFSEKCNIGAMKTDSSVIIFLNDDTEFIDSSSIEQLVEKLENKNVGAVGAQLLFPSGKIQHAGLAFKDSNINHAFADLLPDAVFYTANRLSHEVSAVTGACLGMRRDVFMEVNGWDEQFPNSFNDVDLCMRISESGYSIIQDNAITLIHHESVSRVTEPDSLHLELLKKRWSSEMQRDRFLRTDFAFNGLPTGRFMRRIQQPISLRILSKIKNEGLGAIPRLLSRLFGRLRKELLGSDPVVGIPERIY